MKIQHHVIPRYFQNEHLCSIFNRLLVCFSAGYFFPVPIAAQVNNAGPLYISGNVFVNTTFTNTSTAAYKNDGSLYLTGDFTNNQEAMTEGTGATLFTGSSLQNISGTKSPVFHKVSINNNAGVRMNINTTIGDTISILPVAGSLYFNGHALTMGGKINPAYTNTSAFNVTPTSDLNITGKAGTGNNLYFAASGDTLHNLTVSANGTGKLGNALNITAGSSFGTVTVDGSFEAAGFLTLKSDANGTSRINNSAGTVTGNVTVERYIPARRAWRFLSVPVNNDTLHIRTAWQEGVNNPSLTVRYNPHPGFGTQITGDNNTANGFDFNTTSNASVKTWIHSTNSWSTTAPPTVSTLINAYPAYCIFVRGSRAVDLAQATSAVADPTVLRITGTVNNGALSKPYTSLITNNLILAGNPYASSIDIAPVLTRSTGIYNDKFWVWDPALAGNYGVGGYITYIDGVMAPLTPNYPSTTTIIQGGQAFLLQANAASANVGFVQADKTASERMVFGKPVKKPVVYVNLMTPSADSVALTDGVAASFGKNYSANSHPAGAVKQWNFNENIALVRNSGAFAIEFRPVPQKTDTLFLRLYIRQQPYSFEIFSQNLPADFPPKAWIVDKYLGTQTEVNLYDTSLYSFTPNTDTNSYRNRFMLVFSPADTKTVNPGKEKEIVTTDAAGAGIYPNPVTDNNFNLVLNNLKAGNYGLSIYTATGRLVLTHKITYEVNKASYSIHLPAALDAGSYTLLILNNNGDTVKSIPFIISGK